MSFSSPFLSAVCGNTARQRSTVICKTMFKQTCVMARLPRKRLLARKMGFGVGWWALTCLTACRLHLEVRRVCIHVQCSVSAAVPPSVVGKAHGSSHCCLEISVAMMSWPMGYFFPSTLQLARHSVYEARYHSVTPFTLARKPAWSLLVRCVGVVWEWEQSGEMCYFNLYGSLGGNEQIVIHPVFLPHTPGVLYVKEVHLNSQYEQTKWGSI